MDATEVLMDGIDRISDNWHAVIDELDTDRLAQQPGGTANSIGWLTWHVARVQDAQVADLAGGTQLWISGGYAERLGFDADPGNSGYGHSAGQAAAVRIEAPDVLVDYFDAVSRQSSARLAGLTSSDLDRVIDDSYDPPVTEGVRWVSIVDDCAQHLGQAAYARGLLGV